MRSALLIGNELLFYLIHLIQIFLYLIFSFLENISSLLPFSIYREILDVYYHNTFINYHSLSSIDFQAFGTTHYIAPEVILMKGYGRPVDWWSMGIILHKFLVGSVPFNGKTDEQIYIRILTGK